MNTTTPFISGKLYRFNAVAGHSARLFVGPQSTKYIVLKNDDIVMFVGQIERYVFSFLFDDGVYYWKGDLEGDLLNFMFKEAK